MQGGYNQHLRILSAGFSGLSCISCSMILFVEYLVFVRAKPAALLIIGLAGVAAIIEAVFAVESGP